MTKEEKTLLTKVLCEQLPYNVKVHCKWFMYKETTPTEDIGVLVQISNKKALVKRQNQTTAFYLNSCGCNILPYLRPLSSITEDEMEELKKLRSGLLWRKDILRDIVLDIWYSTDAFDYLNAKHFDIRGLISMGLAIAAVGNDNPYKEKGGTK